MPATLADTLHTLSPFAVRFSESFGVRWYGLSYVAGFIFAYFIIRAFARRALTPIPFDRVGDAMFTIVLGVLVGGRLGYVLVYQRGLLTDFSSAFPYWGLLALNQGGMASHGAMVGLILAAWRVSRGFAPLDPAGRAIPGAPRVGQTSLLHVMDLLALVSPFGVFLGRIANFINGELLGKIVAAPAAPGSTSSSAPWWAVRFPQELEGWRAYGVRAPDSHAPPLSAEQQLALKDLVESSLTAQDRLLPIERQWGAGLHNVLESAGNHQAALRALVSARHPSQLYQAVAEGVIVGIVVWVIWARPRAPGVVAAWWFISYGLLRVLTEFWRLPDAQFLGDAARPLGLSRGQWLSVAMVIGGAVILLLVRRSTQRMGGWLRPASAAT
ncbi:MAG: prolipoprotein diacylglyceryl transferase [Phycisphaerales bacterium]